MKHSVPKNYDLKQDKNAAPGRFQAFCADFFHHIDLLQIIPMLIRDRAAGRRICRGDFLETPSDLHGNRFGILDRALIH